MKKKNYILSENFANDLDIGIDNGGDLALFIDEKHLKGNTLDMDVKKLLTELNWNMVFFRIIKNKKQTSNKGYIDGKTKEIKWV